MLKATQFDQVHDFPVEMPTCHIAPVLLIYYPSSPISGISKPMVCQTYGLHSGRL